MQLREIAPFLQQLDVECYERHGRDPFEPLVGLGRPDAPWCFIGRDPGEQEVRCHRPFVGSAGQKIRAVMDELRIPDEDIFWINTVPFKPKGNKPWPVSVQRQCQPALAQLFGAWQGHRVITFGETAFNWFALGGDARTRAQFRQFSLRPDKYSAQFDVSWDAAGEARDLALLPVPHPSGANARWASAFAGLLRVRLAPLLPFS